MLLQDDLMLTSIDPLSKESLVLKFQVDMHFEEGTPFNPQQRARAHLVSCSARRWEGGTRRSVGPEARSGMNSLLTGVAFPGSI